MTSSSQKALWYFLTLQLDWHYALASSSTHNATVHYAFSTNKTLSASFPSSASQRPTYSISDTERASSTPSTTVHGVGDFVAMGLGISATSEPSTTHTSETTASTRSLHTSSSLASLPHSQVNTGGGSQQNASHIQTLRTSPSSIETRFHATSVNTSATPSGYYPMEDPTTPPVWLNRSLTLSGDCWNQWSQFWSAEDLPVQEWTSNSQSTYTSTITEENEWVSTSTIYSFVTTTIFNGRFPITTYSTTAPERVYVWYTGTPTTTWIATRTVNPGYSVIEGPSFSFQSPSCVLPTSVSQCQESWNYWVNQKTTGKQYETWGPEDGPPGCDPRATTMIPWSCQAPLSTWESARSSWYAKQDPPKCSQATVADDYCSSARSQFIHNGEQRGYYFSDAQTTATTIFGVSQDVTIWPSNSRIGGPGCTLGCGNCALQGETVELIFWPPATSLANDTALASPTIPWTVETLGTTFTSPTVYISFDTLWAKNSCSKIGRTITNAIVAITKTEDMSSLYGYRLSAGGRQLSASFDFADLYQDPTPDEIYESQPRCWASSMAAKGGRYRPLPSDYPGCAHTEPYEPIIVIPVEIRALDLEWAECQGGIEGVYDPPLALRPTNSIVVPTRSQPPSSTSTAAPAPNPFSNETPQTTQSPSSSPKPTVPSLPPVQETNKDPVEAPATPSSKEKSATARGNGNVWPLPMSDFDFPETTNALSILESALHSVESARSTGPHTSNPAKPQESSENAEHDSIGNAHGTKGQDDPIDHATRGPTEPEHAAAVWTHKGDVITAILANGAAVIHGDGAATTVPIGAAGTFKGQAISVPVGTNFVQVDGTTLILRPGDKITAAHEIDQPATAVLTAAAVWIHESQDFTAILTDGAAVIHGIDAVTTIAPGNVEMFKGQAISVPSGANFVEVDGAVLSLSSIGMKANDVEISDRATAVFTASGQTLTAIIHGSSVVLQAAGTTTTLAYEAKATFAGQTISLPGPGSGIVDVNGELITMQALEHGSDVRTLLSAEWTQYGETFTAKMQGESTIILEAPSTTIRIAAGSMVTVGDSVASMASVGNVLVYDGTSITLDRAMSTDPAMASTASGNSDSIISAVDAGSSVIVAVGGKTFTLADGAQTRLDKQLISAVSSGGAIVVDGTTTLARSAHTSTVHPSESEGSRGTKESTAATTDVANSAATQFLLVQGSMIVVLFSFVAILL